MICILVIQLLGGEFRKGAYPVPVFDNSTPKWWVDSVTTCNPARAQKAD